MRKYSPEGIVASVLFIVLFGVVLLQIFGRTPLVSGPVWTEEMARWLWVWMAFVGIGAVERDDAQLRMGFLVEALPGRGRLVLFTLIDLVYLGIVGHLVLIAFRTVERHATYAAVTLPVPDAVLYASGFVAMLLILHRVLRRLFSRRKLHHATETTL